MMPRARQAIWRAAQVVLSVEMRGGLGFVAVSKKKAMSVVVHALSALSDGSVPVRWANQLTKGASAAS
jgi:hypothetical protein